ncbi:MAG: dihydroorotase [Bacillota bacterium]|jgi:allantoinase
MIADKNIINGQVWMDHRLNDVGVAVKDGKIVAVCDKEFLPEAKEIIDADGCVVLPGAIDSHVHGRDPGSTEREDFYTITAAAACGGITTIFDMPNNLPPTSNVKNFEEKREMAEKKAYVDFALYAGAGSDNIDDISDLADAGAIAFKTFLTKLAPDRVDEMVGLIIKEDGSFVEVMKAIKETGLLSCVHAENKEINEYYLNKLQAAGRKDVYAFSEARPPISEIEGTARTLCIAKYTGTRVHMCHIFDPEAVNLVEKARAEGQEVSCELTPNYLFLSEEDMEHLGPHGCVFPPLRGKEYQKAIFKNYAEGKIDIINSDHAPYTMEEIELGKDDIFLTPPDGCAIEVMLPLLLNEVNKGTLTLSRVVETFMEKPAQLFGIYPRKGAISVGSDADMILVDMQQTRTLHGKELHTKQHYTQYENWQVKGTPIMTMVRGEVVMKGGQLVGRPGWGTFIKPEK